MARAWLGHNNIGCFPLTQAIAGSPVDRRSAPEAEVADARMVYIPFTQGHKLFKGRANMECGIPYSRAIKRSKQTVTDLWDFQDVSVRRAADQELFGRCPPLN